LKESIGKTFFGLNSYFMLIPARHVYTLTYVFFRAHPQRKFVVKNGLFSLVG